ncbi:MAG: tetratricopeptide repeat protein [Elusimicrobia bacterium]|nr:tetratricopeptide repeat protein [Elusimicrobiota bacterium]
MGKRRPAPALEKPSETPSPPLGLKRTWLLLWTAALAALAFVPDEKLTRQKLLSGEAAAWLAVLSVAAASASGRLKTRVRTSLDLAVAAYAAAGLAFYALSPEPSVSLPELTRMLLSAAVFFSAAQTLAWLEPGTVASLWCGPAALVGLYGALQASGGLGPLDVPRLERPFGTFGNPIFLGAYLSASLCVAAGLAAGAAGPGRWLAAAAALACGAGLWLAQSRAAFAGLAAAGALWLPRLASGRTRAAWLAVIGAGAAFAAWRLSDRPATHDLIWQGTVRLWLDQPWLGCGLGRYHIEFPAYASAALRKLWPQERVIVNFAHNEYLQVLAETGLAGAAAVGAVLAAFGRWAWKEWPGVEDPARSRLCAGFAAAATALWVQALGSPDLRFGVSSFFLFFAMAAAAAFAKPRLEPAGPAWTLSIGAGAALFLVGWGGAAAQPFLAQRKVARDPGFHAEAGPEVRAAIARLEAKLAEEPANADLAENLAYLYARERAWEPAIDRYALAARLAPSRPGPFNNLGNLYYTLGDIPRAIEHWNRSLELEPGQLDARLNLGKALYESGRLKESARHLEAALRLDPANEKARVLLKKMVE